MRIRCKQAFRDLKAEGKPRREIGDEWECTPDRLAEINGTAHGILAVEVPKPKRQTRKKAAE